MNPFKDAEFVCIYGWDETLYQKALAWANSKRKVAIVTEEELTSTSPFVKIYTLESPIQIEPLAKQIGWSAVFLQLKIICVSGGEVFQKELEKAHLAASMILSEASDLSVAVLKNAKENRTSYKRGMELENAFKDIPAIIIGAGPSLEKHSHLLASLEKKALLFAGGSALNIIKHEPHFAASIDAAAPHKQFKEQPFKKTPFCYQARMSSQNLSCIAGEKLLFPDSFSDAINWMHEEEHFDSGWTVGTFLTAIAMHLGCSPIIFVGMDLCYTGGKKYAKIAAETETPLIEARGKYTQRDWLMAAEWIEGKAAGRKLFDLSEGILQLPKADLGNLIQEWDLRQMVANAIQKLEPKLPTDRVADWEASLERCHSSVEGEIVHEKLLLPLWHIWKPIFERTDDQNMALHQQLFFQRVINEHK